MAQIQHIALTAIDNEGLASFYVNTFGMREVFRHADPRPDRPNAVAVYLTDGHINLAVLPNGGGRPEGINHFGFIVDDIEEARQLGVANGAKPGSNDLPRDGRYAEGYLVDPVGQKVDLTDKGWDIGEGRPE